MRESIQMTKNTLWVCLKNDLIKDEV